MLRSLLLVALAGCGRLAFDPFGSGTDAAAHDGSVDPDARDDGSIDAPIDAAIDAPIDARTIVPVSSIICTNAQAQTVFPGGAIACTDWIALVTESGATVTEVAGALVISPAPAVSGAFGQCRRDIQFDAAGVFVEISDVVDGASSFTSVGLGGAGDVYSMSVRNGVLFAQHTPGTLATIPYDPVAMRWWRIRPITGGVLYETAPDAAAWTLLATSNLPSSQTTQVTLFGGVGAAEAAPGTARFETVNLCP